MKEQKATIFAAYAVTGRSYGRTVVPAAAAHKAVGARLPLILLVMVGILSAAGCGPPDRMTTDERDRLKGEVMMEVMIEVRKELAAYGVTGESVAETREQLKWEIEQEILVKLQMLVPDSAMATAAGRLERPTPNMGPVGIAEGLVLRGDEGLADCRVKLVRLIHGETILGLLQVLKEDTAVEFTVVTDEDGQYRFENVPVGSYKLKWQLPGDKGWIRRLREGPDVLVEAEQTSVLNTIQTARGVVPR